MSTEVAHTGHGHGHGDHPPHLAHQFEDRPQQDESYSIGMWTFLVTEIMFFGALFLAFAIYRTKFPEAFHLAHKTLEVKWGMINTFVLLFSSFTMAIGVRFSQLGNKKGLLAMLGITILCAFVFLGVKTIEYKSKYDHHHVPGAHFSFVVEEKEDRTNPATINTFVATADSKTQADLPTSLSNNAQMFFALYFCMTGLHGFHVIVGIIILGTLFLMTKFDHPAAKYFMVTEMAGLYWHFVDIVWIFLFPLLYLLG